MIGESQKGHDRETQAPPLKRIRHTRADSSIDLTQGHKIRRIPNKPSHILLTAPFNPIAASATMQSLRTFPRAAASFRAFSTSAPRPLAKFQIIGRLADSPETSPTSTGQEITKFAVGVGSGPRDEMGRQAHVSWFRVATFLEDGPQRRLLQELPKG